MRAELLDVLVVGGGLSGLMVSIGLERTGVEWKILDARDVLGGRIANDNSGHKLDLGGTWIWPEYQPCTQRLLKELSIPCFCQPGDPLSNRIVGGAVKIIDHLASNLPPKRILLNSPVRSCTLQSPDNLCSTQYVRVETIHNEIFDARRVVFAVPPEILAERVMFDPPLLQEKQESMTACRTWMSGVTKISLVYPKKFWDSKYSNIALGGDGPAFQVYDASTADGEVHALTFLTQVSPMSPAYTSNMFLALQVSQQLSNEWTFMEKEDLACKANTYSSYHLKRWPNEAYISKGDSKRGSYEYSDPNPILSQSEWGGKLQFAGSETDLTSPGDMEGAVGSALRVLKDLLPRIQKVNLN